MDPSRDDEWLVSYGAPEEELPPRATECEDDLQLERWRLCSVGDWACEDFVGHLF